METPRVYKQMVLGLNGSTADQACPHCLVHANDCHDISKPFDCYDTCPHCHTIKQLTGSEMVAGQKLKPFISIPIDHMVVEKLHVLLRITDVLADNRVLDAVQRDSKNGVNQLKNGPHLKTLLSAIQAPGVSCLGVTESKKIC